MSELSTFTEAYDNEIEPLLSSLDFKPTPTDDYVDIATLPAGTATELPVAKKRFSVSGMTVVSHVVNIEGIPAIHDLLAAKSGQAPLGLNYLLRADVFPNGSRSRLTAFYTCLGRAGMSQIDEERLSDPDEAMFSVHTGALYTDFTHESYAEANEKIRKKMAPPSGADKDLQKLEFAIYHETHVRIGRAVCECLQLPLPGGPINMTHFIDFTNPADLTTTLRHLA